MSDCRRFPIGYLKSSLRQMHRLLCSQHVAQISYCSTIKIRSEAVQRSWLSFPPEALSALLFYSTAQPRRRRARIAAFPKAKAAKHSIQPAQEQTLMRYQLCAYKEAVSLNGILVDQTTGHHSAQQASFGTYFGVSKLEHNQLLGVLCFCLAGHVMLEAR